MVHTWRDERHSADPERLIEERTFDRCRRSMDLRRGSSTCVRTSGCQVVLLVFCLVGFLVHVRTKPWELRSTLLSFLLTLEWTVLLGMLASSWVTSVVQCADLVFFWLAITYEEVDSAGASIALSVRRHLLLRVLGLLHCPQSRAPELCKRLDGDPFPPVLAGVASMFHEDQLEADGLSIESGCLFVDDSGEVQRFVWRLESQWDTGVASLAVTTVVRSQDPRDKGLSHPSVQPWAQRDMSFLIDVLSPEVDAIVRSNPWWQKLEFQLKADQSRLSGFRSYLGDKAWNRRSRFVAYATGIPLSLFALLAACHLRYVFWDYWHLIPHCSFVLGIGLSGNFLAAHASHARCARACVNLVMYALETQVNKDWAILMGAEPLADPEAHWRQPQLARAVDSIPALWQVASCRPSLQRAAAQALRLAREGGRRRRPPRGGWGQ